MFLPESHEGKSNSSKSKTWSQGPNKNWGFCSWSVHHRYKIVFAMYNQLHEYSYIAQLNKM